MSDAFPMRIKIFLCQKRKKIGNVFITMLFFSAPLAILAAPPFPNYSTVKEALLSHWKKNHIPYLKFEKMISNPEMRGVLCNSKKEPRICYYHFFLMVKRPYRISDQPKVEFKRKLRKIEIWFQCKIRDLQNKHTGTPCKWKLFFLRRDLLPHTPRFWSKILK